MATASRHLCRSLYQATRHAPVKRKCRKPQMPQLQSIARPYSISASLRAKETSLSSTTPFTPPSRSRKAVEDQLEETTVHINPSEYLTPSEPITVDDLDPDDRADYDVLPKDKQTQFLGLQNHYKALVEAGPDDAGLDKLATDIVREMQRNGEDLDFPITRPKGKEIGFWAMDEEDEFSQVEDADDEVSPDLITSVAESELEVHREVREYTRVVAWDMPLLRKFAKPFSLPDMTKTPLRFRYTTYMGEHHPAAAKVVVQFCTRELPGLTETQRLKLLKLLGPRYNPDTDIARMSSEKFETPAQNKRYLGDLVNALITEAKDPKDTFEDVPLDLRHHKAKKRVLFPEEWKLTDRSVKVLAEVRQSQGRGRRLLLGGGAEEGEEPQVVDGRRAVEEYVVTRSMASPAAPVGGILGGNRGQPGSRRR